MNEQDIYRIIRFWTDDKNPGKIWQCTIDYVLANHEESIANLVYFMNEQSKRRYKKPVRYSYEKVIPKDSLIEGIDDSLVDETDFHFAFTVFAISDNDKEKEVKLEEGAELCTQFHWNQNPL